jgi:hypothetical protein
LADKERISDGSRRKQGAECSSLLALKRQARTDNAKSLALELIVLLLRLKSTASSMKVAWLATLELQNVLEMLQLHVHLRINQL